MTVGDRLVDCLKAEHAAIFGYGVIGAHLDAGTVNDVAAQAEAAHRARRDALLVRLTGKGITPPPADPVYTLPSPVTDKASALQLALTIEERTASIWARALPETTGDDRKLALDALADAAMRATRVRRVAGIEPVTVPFPGRS
jgi:hypothetical protein